MGTAPMTRNYALGQGQNMHETDTQTPNAMTE